jgi:hypothetical protein
MNAVLPEEDRAEVTVPELSSDPQYGDDVGHYRFLVAITCMAASRLIFRNLPPWV